jgi:tripartite-type tricarboxylate transporter receptor subunit TctC
VARQLAPKFSARFGQNFIIESVSGGGTNIAGQRVARAAPDGHTLYIHNLQISANVSLYKTLPFDTEKDFAPIGMINSNPLVLVGKKQLAANTLPELVAWMKSSPTPAKMAHPGTGSTGHLATFLLAQALGVKVDHIPYRGAAPMLQDILGGHVDLFFATPQQVVGQFASGAVKVFGITSKETSPQFPGVPSFVQAYGPKLEISFWHIMLAPAATPGPIIATLNAALQEAVADSEILRAWANSGMAPYPPQQRTPEGAAAYLKQQIAHWGEVVRDNNIEAPTN